MMIVKKHVTPDKRLILAVCDSDLVGKTLSDDKKQLDLKSSFFRGVEETQEKVLKLMKCAYMLNLVGKDSIALALDAGLINEQAIINIAGVPHAQAVLLE